MTFAQAYRELECKFKARVDLDKHIHGIESVFLPNVEPTGQVDYVLVGMEPGLSGCDKDFETAKQKIAKGKCENWGRCPQTNTLVFAVWKYLCDKDKATYYFTDLAHGTMKAGSKGAKDPSKYERWFPLLEEELGLVAKPNAKIISIGNTASKFLAEKGLHGQAGMVAHPAPMGLGFAGKAIPANKERWDKFLRDTASKDTDQFPTKVKKTLAQQKLVFDYMIRFERIRNPAETGWVARSREWEGRLS